MEAATWQQNVKDAHHEALDRMPVYRRGRDLSMYPTRA